MLALAEDGGVLAGRGIAAVECLARSRRNPFSVDQILTGDLQFLRCTIIRKNTDGDTGILKIDHFFKIGNI